MVQIIKSRTLIFTSHSRRKMRHYGLSEQRVRRLIHSPKRVEEGIAPKTIALMQPASLKRVKGVQMWSQEIWVMIQDEKSRRKVISAWRYPGMTKARTELSASVLRSMYREYAEAETDFPQSNG